MRKRPLLSSRREESNRGRVPVSDLPVLVPAQRVLLADQVARAIEQEIAAQRWREWLPSERSLQRQLNVSRQTIRAALAQLEGRRTVAVQPYRGYRITGTPVAGRPEGGNRCRAKWA